MLWKQKKKKNVTLTPPTELLLVMPYNVLLRCHITSCWVFDKYSSTNKDSSSFHYYVCILYTERSMLRITLINMLGRHVAAECWGTSRFWRMHAGGCCVGYKVEATSTTSVWWQYCRRRALFMCRYFILFVLLAEAILKDKQETNIRELLVLMDSNVEL